MAIQALGCTIAHLTKAGRFRQAADREKEIGQIYQHELNDIAKACDSFQRAAEWYDQEDAAAYVRFFTEKIVAHFCYRTASACRKDAADLCAEVENYRGAIQLYEMVVSYALKSNLTKYSVKDYWLRSGLCALAMKVCFSLMRPTLILIIVPGCWESAARHRGVQVERCYI